MDTSILILENREFDNPLYFYLFLILRNKSLLVSLQKFYKESIERCQMC